MKIGQKRCEWPGSDEQMLAYHDTEWGVPVFDSRELFEHLTLDGFQAGLSWATILRKREHFRRAFDGFHPEKIAGYGEAETARLLGDAGIVRNRLKIAAAIKNARAWLELRESGIEFGEFLWQFTGGRPVVNRWRSVGDLPCESPESGTMSRALKKLGFSFVGSTICYAFMQAVGMVNDHVVQCARHEEIIRQHYKPEWK